jgi:MoxR-like ATPase
MARPKKTYRCYSCGIDFTFEKGANNDAGVFVKSDDGAVRKVEITTGQIHYCKGVKQDNIAGSPSASSEEKLEQAQQSAQSTQSNQSQPEKAKTEKPKSQDGKSLGDTLKDDIESKTPSSGSEQNPANEPLWKLVEPFAETQVKSHTSPIIDSVKLVADLLEISIEDLSTRVKNIEDFDAHVKSTGGNKVIDHTVTLVTEHEVKKIDGCHRQQADLIKTLSVRDFNGNRLNVLLVGPAGTGKTTAAAKAADILGLNFYPLSVGPQTTKSDFFGFTDAHGRAVWTVIREAWTNGGVLLIDEMDTATGALTYMNAMLANDYVSFPSDIDTESKVTIVRKHKDFVVIAAANTYGKGANRMYTSRQALDMATLDRFIGIDWDYDTDFERKIGANSNQSAWVEYVWALRKHEAELSLRLVFGTRRIIQGCALLNAGFSLADTKEKTVWFGVSPDDKTKLKNRIGEK